MGRRRFLSVTGLASLSLGGWLTESAAAAQSDYSSAGYGMVTFGEAGYGGVESTNN
jgi:hypothetical protein